jgi:hypothetical protein
MAEGHVPTGVKWLRAAWMICGVAGIAAVLFFVVFPPRTKVSAHAPTRASSTGPKRAVEVQDDGTIRISTDAPFAERLESIRLTRKRITDPLLTVSGIVVAKVLPGTEDLSERWHFDTPELASAYANWRKSVSEVEFSRNILEKTKELVTAETKFLTEQVERLEPGAKSGVVPERELRSARAELLKAQLQGQKDVFSTQSAFRVADNGRIALERELSQRGIEPVVFGRGVETMVLVSANVPEAKVSQVREGQSCRVRFYAYADKVFDGHVETLSTTVTHELRTLRVLFDLADPDGLLIPGMFAEVELGTDERDAFVIPDTALLHVGQVDYVLVQTEAGAWKPQEVRIGEFRRGTFEVLQGVTDGETIMSKGAVLLKPKLVEAISRLQSKGP